MNFVLNPKPYYVDPLESVFEDPVVERNFDCLFSLEAIGITENTLSSYDYKKIQEFKIPLPFRMDLIISTSLGMKRK